VKGVIRLRFSCARGSAGALLLGLLTLGLCGLQPRTAAHGILAAYIQHGVHVKVDGQNIDLTLDLTFFEGPSARERALMDIDANGRITRAEVDAYLKKLSPALFKQVKLRVAGREVPLVPLYDPEIDLFNEQTTALAHHRLRLYFFAVTPAELRTGDEILVEDQLWPESKSFGTPQAEGGDGCNLVPENSVRVSSALKPALESRQFRFRCLTPPKLKPTATANARISASSRPRSSTP
jgi:hypothetical protein